jgi:hypothetical protein
METTLERKLFKKVYKFIRSFNPTLRLKLQEEEFCYAIDFNTVMLDLNEIIFEADDEFMDKQILKEKGFLLDISMPTFYLLHEIAHSMLDQNNFEMYKLQKSALSLIECDYTLNKLYREIDDEKKADQFAYNLYLHNYDYVRKFDKEIMEIINNF